MSHHSQAPVFLRQFKRTALCIAVATVFAPLTLANPVTPTVAHGSATFSTTGNTLTVVNTPGTIINWQQFNIDQNEITRFVQQSSQSTVLNRITGQDPSQILGTLQSNGRVFLLNPNGILFGRNAVIDVFGLVASNLNLSDANFLANRFSFSGGGAGEVINKGAITTPVGGSVYLIGSQVKNEGLITSPKGAVLLAAGNSVSLADTGTPSMSVTLTASGNQAINLGQITAQGGRIDIYGALIDQQGILRADSAAVDQQGRIVLKATDTVTVSGTITATNSAGKGGTVQVLGDEVTLTGTARLDVSGTAGGGKALIGGDYQGKNAAVQNATNTTIAAGATIKADATGKGNGGRVIVWANDKTIYDGFISARGGAAGGDGGFVETSGHAALSVGGRVDTTAAKGKTGMWLLDPPSYCIEQSAGDCVIAGFSATTIYSAAQVETFLGASNVQLAASDYFAYMPGGGSYTYVIPAGRSMEMYAPYIYVNGTFQTTQPLWMRMIATSGTSTTWGYSQLVEFDTGANLTTGGGGLRVEAGSVNVASGASVDVGNGGINVVAGSILSAGGNSFTAHEVEIETNSITGPLPIYSDYMRVVPWHYYTGGTRNVYLGVNNADPRCATALCIFNQLTGTVTDGLEIDASNNLYVEGSFNNPANRLALVADHGTLYLNAPVSVPGLAGEPVAAMFGAHTRVVNNAGAGAITTGTGHWVIIAPDQSAIDAGGLTASSQLALYDVFNTDYATESAFWDALMAALNPAAAAGNVFGYWNLQVVDTCQIDPSVCAPTKPNLPDVVNDIVVADLSGTRGLVTYDAKLKVGGKGKKKDDEAGDKKEGQGKTAARGDGMRRAKDEDARKSSAELKEEAKQARAEEKKSSGEARKLESEAKKAETEAKQAETASRKTKAEDRRMDAESRKHHAESKRAEAESKKAEAGSRKAEAEAKEAAAEAKEAKNAEQKAAAERKADEKRTESLLRKAEAEVKKVKAEVKKVEAEAKKAEAEAKKAEHKAEAQAKQAEAQAKKSEAEKKGAERRAEAIKSFAKIASATLSAEKLAAVVAQRHEFKTEALAPALSIIERNPKVADMPICAAGGSDICVPAQRMAPPGLPTPPTPVVSFLPQIQRKVAVVIGIDKYADPAVPPLESAVQDAQAVGNLLQDKFGYEVKVIPNANRADIVKSINAISRSVGPDDSVAIYYAGHGYLMEKNNTGYWIPSDGSVKDPSGWINNDDIARMLNAIPARQVMLVSDSCYSGSLTREATVAPAGNPADILGKRSVIVMSSGGEEPVSDEGRDGHSIFAWSLMNSLKGVEQVEPGSKAFENVRTSVIGEFPQVPHYGAATSAGHTPGGDYLFEVRSYK